MRGIHPKVDRHSPEIRRVFTRESRSDHPSDAWIFTVATWRSGYRNEPVLRREDLVSAQDPVAYPGVKYISLLLVGGVRRL